MIGVGRGGELGYMGMWGSRATWRWWLISDACKALQLVFWVDVVGESGVDVAKHVKRGAREAAHCHG